MGGGWKRTFTRTAPAAYPVVISEGFKQLSGNAFVAAHGTRISAGVHRPTVATVISTLKRLPAEESKVMALGNNAHLFARPHRRELLRQLFEDVLRVGVVTTVPFPGMAEPMLLIRFSGGGSLSIEFVETADDSDEPRLATWLELGAEDPAAMMRTALEAGFRQVTHPGHPYYFMAPGGQVFTIAPLQKP